MGDLHHGGSRLDQAPQDRQQLMAGLEVEGTARLIQHQHLRLVNQGASDQQAAPLSVRQLSAAAFTDAVEVQLIEQISRLPAATFQTLGNSSGGPASPAAPGRHLLRLLEDLAGLTVTRLEPNRSLVARVGMLQAS